MKDFTKTATAAADKFIAKRKAEKQAQPEEQEFYRFSLKLDGDLKAFIEDEAWMNHISRNDFINAVLKGYKEAKEAGAGKE